MAESASNSATTAIVRAPVETYVPEHGRGRLARGGIPGNPGGGRPPEELRRYSREVYENVVRIIAKRVKDDPNSVSMDDLAKIATITARVGIPQAVEVAAVGTLADLLIEAFGRALAP